MGDDIGNGAAEVRQTIVDSEETSQVIKIVLPYNAKNHSHNKGHWRAKSAMVKAMRELAAWQAKIGDYEPITGSHKVSYRFYFPDNRKRDLINWAQSCKPYIDGIVDAGIIEGDHWQISGIGTITACVDKANPRIEITIEKA